MFPYPHDRSTTTPKAAHHLDARAPRARLGDHAQQLRRYDGLREREPARLERAATTRGRRRDRHTRDDGHGLAHDDDAAFGHYHEHRGAHAHQAVLAAPSPSTPPS